MIAHSTTETTLLPRGVTGRSARGRGRGQAQINRRTLALIRWTAISGQCIAVLVVAGALGFAVPLLPITLVIAAAVVANLLLLYPQRDGPLGEVSLAANLAFDIVQLAALLYLTGGLQNPFALMIVAPVTVAAAVLDRATIMALTGLVLTCTAVLAIAYQPLPWADGGLELPPLYRVGVWTALNVACLFIVAYVWHTADAARRMASALGETRLALAREQEMSSLGALAAAAAHELGNPLSTIALVSTELSRDVPPDSPYAADIALLQSQSDRCREILTELARNPHTMPDGQLNRLGLRGFIDSIAAPYRRPGVELVIAVAPGVHGAEPVLQRGPELVHGLANLLQNALQFARSEVRVDLAWDDALVAITITDDGPGFPAWILSRIGEPYLSSRSEAGDSAHLGLGIFIAMTLLERQGAALRFENVAMGGARVVLRWSRDEIDQSLIQRNSGDV